jgi:hypothetical protein
VVLVAAEQRERLHLVRISRQARDVIFDGLFNLVRQRLALKRDTRQASRAAHSRQDQPKPAVLFDGYLAIPESWTWSGKASWIWPPRKLPSM